MLKAKALSKLTFAGILMLSLAACGNALEDPVAAVTDTTGSVVGDVGGADADIGSPIKSGSFTGENKHVVTGKASLVPTADGLAIYLDESFTLDGAPDPKVAFGPAGSSKPTSIVAPLRSLKGAQAYTLPANVKASEIGKVWIWCQKFDVSLGVTSL